MKRTQSFYDVRDALSEPGCPLCRLNEDVADRFLDGLLWESVNDSSVRRSIRQAQGFCRQHAWGLVRYGSSLGVAIIMRDVFQSLLESLEDVQYQRVPLLSLRRAQEAVDRELPAAATEELVARLSPRETCPACKQVNVMEGLYLRALLDNLVGHESLLSAFQASDGLCLPHLRQALQRVRNEASFKALMGAQYAIWKRLLEHLDENVRKSDYRFRDEPRGDEADAWLRAVASLVGPRAKKRK